MEAIFGKALQLAHEYETEMGHFLRDLIAIPSPSRKERDVINRITQETQVVSFDQIQIDPMGNLQVISVMASTSSLWTLILIPSELAIREIGDIHHSPAA